MRHTEPTPRDMSREAFPEALIHIPKPPKRLRMVGSPPPAHQKYVTFVGSRKCTRYAQEVTERLIQEMSGFPVAIISGLAYGVDAIAHQAALDSGLTTIAFPGSGLDPSTIYPAGHRQLANQIVMAGGCLLSEFDDTQPALPWTFPVRNRLMAGMADVVVVVEAREKSGSLITAREALDYGKTVMVVPGHIYNDAAAGSNQLLYDGATPVLSASTILHELGFSVDATSSPQKRRSYTNEEQQIIDLLYEPQHRSTLAEQLKIAIYVLNQRLSEMEIKGLVTEQGGMIRRL
jgi:DNA processing protein